MNRNPSNTEGTGALSWALVIFESVRRHLPLCLSTALLGFLLSFYAVLQVPHTFTSVAILQIKKSLTTLLTESAGLQDLQVGGRMNEDYREIQTQLLRSEDLFARVADRRLSDGIPLRDKLQLGLSDDRHVSPYDHLEEVRASVTIDRPLKSALVTLRIDHSDPHLAREVCEIYLEEYRAMREELYDLGPVLAAIEEEAAQSKEKYGRLELEISNALRVAGVSDLDQELGDLWARRAALQSRRDGIEIDVLSLDSEVGRLASALNRIPEGFPAEPYRQENKDRLSLLERADSVHQRLLESPFLEGTPEYRVLSAPITDIQSELVDTPAFLIEPNPATPNPHYYSLVAESAHATGRLEGQRRSLEEVGALLQSTGSRIRQLEDLQESQARRRLELDVLREEWEDKRDRAYEIRRATELNDEELLWATKTLQSPSLPSHPSSIARRYLLLAALAASVAIGLFAGLLRGLLFESRLRNEQEIACLTGIRPLAVFEDPHPGGLRPARSQRPSLRLVTGALASRAAAEERSIRIRITGVDLGLKERWLATEIGRRLESRLSFAPSVELVEVDDDALDTTTPDVTLLVFDIGRTGRIEARNLAKGLLATEPGATGIIAFRGSERHEAN